MSTLSYLSESGFNREIVYTSSIEHREGSSILIDMHSFKVAVRDFKSGRLLSKTSVQGYLQDIRYEEEEIKEGVLQLLDTLSCLICFEKVVLDVRALQSFQYGHTLIDLLTSGGLMDSISLLEFPREFYTKAGFSADRLRAALPGAQSSGQFMQRAIGMSDELDVDDEILKDMSDGYRNHRFSETKLSGIYNIGNTGESAERLLVYLELANSLDIPCSLSRAKQLAADVFGPKLIAATQEALQQRGRDRYVSDLTKLQSMISDVALKDYEISVPPLPGYILQGARERNLSLLDATRWLRDSPGAVSFREWLWLKRRALNPVFASDALETKRIETQLSELGERIASESSATGIFVNRSKLAICSSKIPLIGQLLTTLGIEDIPMSLRLFSRRDPPLYEIFMASWFSAGKTPLNS